MNKAELIELVSQKTKFTKTQSEALLDATLEIIQKQVSKGHEVKLVGFGTFSRVKRKAKQGRNPKTGETVKIPATNVPRFKPGKDFKQSMS